MAATARALVQRIAPVPPAFPTFRLFYKLPPVLGLMAPALHPPSADGCQLRIDRAGLVHITGASRRQVQDHLARFLRTAAKGRPPIPPGTVIVHSPPGYWPNSHPYRGGQDDWSFAFVGGKTVFAPTGLGAEVFPEDTFVETSTTIGSVTHARAR
jgi:hypothetical protein